jgi:hypothetical protein
VRRLIDPLVMTCLLLLCTWPLPARAQSATSRPAATQPATTQAADSIEQVLDDFAGWAENVVSVLESATDEATAKAAVKKIETATTEMTALVERLNQLMARSPDPATLKAAQEKFNPRNEAAMTNLHSELQRIEKQQDLNTILAPSLDAMRNAYPQTTRVEVNR